MNSIMNTRNQIIGVWCVPVAMLLFGLSLVPLGKFVPPLAPTMSPSLKSWHAGTKRANRTPR